MKVIKTIYVRKKIYNDLSYYKITSPNNELIESNWETLTIIKGIIDNWKSDKLLGSFGIGFTLAEDAEIIWLL